MIVLLDARLGRKPTGIGHYVLHLAPEVAKIAAPDEFLALTSWRWRSRLVRQGVRTMRSRATPSDSSRLPDVDVVHGPNFHALPHPRAQRVSTILDLGFLTLPECHPPGMPERLDALIRASLSQTSRFICISEHTRDEFTSTYGIEEPRCPVVPLGVDADVFHDRAISGEPRRLRRRYGIERPYVLFVGAMVPRKDVLTLCKAFESLQRDHPDLELVLAGDKARRWASDYDRVQEWLRPRPTTRSRVRWLDYVRAADLPALYRGCSAVALTSLTEGFGMTVLEGLATGRPVVASSAGAIPEIGGSAVRYATPRDPESFAAQLAEAISTGDGPDRRAAARSIVDAHSWSRTGEETLAVYRAAVEDAERASARGRVG